MAAPEHVSIKPGFPSDAAEAGLKRVRVTSRIAGLGSGWRWAGGVTYANVSWQCGLFSIKHSSTRTMFTHGGCTHKHMRLPLGLPVTHSHADLILARPRSCK